MNRTLEVALYGEPIGTLMETDEGRFLFTFLLSFLERGIEAPILSLGMLSPSKHPRASQKTSPQMVPFFSNLLPERGGPLRAYLAAQAGIDVNDDMAFLRLSGHDLPGAVTLRSEESWPRRANSFEIPHDQRRFRFSLAGIQMKFSALRLPGGTFRITQSGEDGTYILKLPDTTKMQVTINEYAMMSFARACGIDVPEIGLVDLDRIEGLPERFRDLEEPVFFIERFDRTENARVHIEDFAQVVRVQPGRKYEGATYDQLLALVYTLLGDEAAAEFIRRLVFTIAIANSDMHLKNWSVIYRDRRKPSLAPAYDYMCIGAYPRYDDKLGLPLNRTVHWESIREETFLDAARFSRPSVPDALVRSALREGIAKVIEAWETFREDPSIPPNIVRTIERQFSTVPLLANRLL